MTALENKARMETICAGLAKGDGQLFRDAMADDFVWTIMGQTKWSGTYRGRDGVRTKLLGPLFKQFKDRYTSTAQRILADGDYVVVQCTGKVTTVSGKPYNNSYCWVVRMSDGKMQELVEYCDTALIDAVLGAPS